MDWKSQKLLYFTLFVILTPVLPAAVPAAHAAEPSNARIEELERRIEILADELRQLKEETALPATVEETPAVSGSQYGSPFAAEVARGKKRRLAIGGYGEASFKSVVGDDSGQADTIDLTRLVLYLGYKFSDRWAFSSEIEFEHATTGEAAEEKGEVSVEFAQIDGLFDPRLNLRAGLLLMPVGLLNEAHEPPFYHGNSRPEVERRIIPTTWRANGAGIFGSFSDRVTYRTYVVSSLDAVEFSSSGIRDGRQSGSKERAEDFSWVGRVDFHPLSGVSFGASTYLGNQGQNRTIAGKRRDVFAQLYEGHASVRTRGLELRGLAAVLELDDAGALSTEVGETIAKRMVGYYVEAAYDVVQLFAPDRDDYLAPWVRYSRIDTQDDVPTGFTADESKNTELIEIGLTYKPIDRIALKLDYRTQNAQGVDLPEELRIGGGFEF